MPDDPEVNEPQDQPSEGETPDPGDGEERPPDVPVEN